jgi:hypothetical protein
MREIATGFEELCGLYSRGHKEIKAMVSAIQNFLVTLAVAI